MKIVRWYTICIYLFVATLVLTGISFSRFSSTLANTGAESVELPDVPDIEFTEWIFQHETAGISLSDMTPGENRHISISVRNWTESESGERISGYDKDVVIELTTTGNLPLEFVLTEPNRGELELYRPSAHQYRSENQSFLAGMKETKKFVLTVIWPESAGDSDYKSEIDYIELSLKAAQA